MSNFRADDRVGDVERLQPSLLDRLTDDDPSVRHEARDKRLLTDRALRNAVLRDLGWLLNTGRLGDVVNFESFPLAAVSVLNFGIADLSGKTASSIGMDEAEQLLVLAIQEYEPRILKETVRVMSLGRSDDLFSPNKMLFEVTGDLWGTPMPIRMYLRTVLDLESGEAAVLETGPR